jgi:ABC-type glycerol-3-phosphate transport system permease component
MAASLVTMLPVIVVFFLAQPQFTRGIALTGLKG